MLTQRIIHFLHSKTATVSIEYGIGLAILGLVMVKAFGTTGTAVTNYMVKIASG